MNDGRDYFDAETLKKLQKRSAEIDKLASEKDAQKVKKLFEGSGAQQALESGDIDAIKTAMQKIVSSDEGERFCRNLSELLK